MTLVRQASQWPNRGLVERCSKNLMKGKLFYITSLKHPFKSNNPFFYISDTELIKTCNIASETIGNNLIMKKLLLLLLACHGFTNTLAQDLTPTLNKIKDHISGTATLSARELVTERNRIVNNASDFQTDVDAVALAFEVVTLYDTTFGALFSQGSSTSGGINPRTANGFNLERVIAQIMQGVLDHSYTESNLKNYPSIFNDSKFQTSSFFPGAVSPPSNPNDNYTVQINGKHIRVAGTPYNYETEDARRPTGCYLAPGSVATVTVPNSLVGIGASILVVHILGIMHLDQI